MKNDLVLEIKRLQEGDLSDFIELVKLFAVVFDMQAFEIPDSKHLRKTLSRENFHVFVAKSEGAVVGGLTTYILEQYYSPKPLAYIFDLAVDIQLQRQGIGKSLIAATTAYYKKNGFEEVFVQADEIDAYAVEFYQKTNPTKEEKVRHFYYQLS